MAGSGREQGGVAEPPVAVANGRRSGDRPWRAIVFAPQGDGATRRRGSDGFRLGLAVAAVACCWLISGTNAGAQVAVTRFLHPPPSGISWLVNTVWWLGSVGVIVTLAALALLSRRANAVRDLLLSGIVAWVLGLVLVAVIGPDGAHRPTSALPGVNLGFPIARVAATVAVVTAALPYLSRSLQRVAEVGLIVLAVATVVNGSGLPISVLASVAVGWGVTAGLHLVFGSPLGLLGRQEVAVLLADLGVVAHGVVPYRNQVWGVARYRARDTEGQLEVSVYGRDAADAQLLAKTFRFVAYRDSGPQLTLSRLQPVEHEAFVTLLAQRAGVRTADVVTAGEAGPSRDALLVTRHRLGRRLGELDEADRSSLPDSRLDEALHQLLLLRSAGVAHGAISPDTVLVADDGTVSLLDFRCASVAAGRLERLDRDLAALMATLALVVGVDRTTAALGRVVPPAVVGQALPFLQRAALGAGAARALRGQKALLQTLRERGAAVAGVEVPELAEPRRLSWVNLLLVVGTLVGGWALIGVLVQVGNSLGTIAGAKWGWVVAVFLLAQLVYVSSAVTVVGSVVEALPFGRVVALEVANTFVGLAGGTMAQLATRVRFFQQDGQEATVAISSGALASTASWIVKGALFLIALPLALSTFHFSSRPSGGHEHLVWLILLVVVAVGLGLGVVLAVPRLRRLARDKLRPKLSDMLHHLRLLLARPRKLAAVFGGQIGAQLLVALALGAALHAFGRHLSLAALLIALTLAAMVGGVSPVPGGMGVVEAGMIFCLTAAGIPQNDAVAATFVQRLFTAYLPPIWGWFVLVWLRRREYV